MDVHIRAQIPRCKKERTMKPVDFEQLELRFGYIIMIVTKD